MDTPDHDLPDVETRVAFLQEIAKDVELPDDVAWLIASRRGCTASAPESRSWKRRLFHHFQCNLVQTLRSESPSPTAGGPAGADGVITISQASPRRH